MERGFKKNDTKDSSSEDEGHLNSIEHMNLVGSNNDSENESECQTTYHWWNQSNPKFNSYLDGIS